MTDRDERGRDVKDRLSKRFEKDKEDESDKPDSKDKSSKNDMNAQQTQRVENVKEAWNSKMVYLPDELNDPVDEEYERLRYECGRNLDWKPKKNRHYYPVVVMDGVETIREMDSDTFRTRVEELELL